MLIPSFLPSSAPLIALNSVVPKAMTPLIGGTHQTLSDVIATLCREKSHRMWVVDELKKPSNVITLTDVMKIFAFDEVPTKSQISGDVTTLWRTGATPHPKKSSSSSSLASTSSSSTTS